MRTFWTPERRERVAELLKEGDTATEIAKKLGAPSRMAVIGIVHRDKKLSAIGFKRAPGKPPSTQRPKASPGPHQEPVKPAPLSDMPHPKARMIPLIELTDRTCKWPIGDPKQPDFGFCGIDKPLEGGPYCAYHARLVYAPRTRINMRGVA